MNRWIASFVVGIITSVVSAVIYENVIKKPAVVDPPPPTQPAPPVKPPTKPTNPIRPRIPRPWEDSIK